MSSRSNGVTNVWLTLRMMAWVDSSARCSSSRIRSAMPTRSLVALSISASRAEPCTSCFADWVKRS